MKLPILMAGLAAVLGASVPQWMQEAASTAHPAYPEKTKGVALFYEERVQVEPTGKQLSTIRKAVKILTRDGKREAVGAVYYDSKGSRVRDFKAWLIYPTGKTKEYTKKDFSEGSSHPDFTMYSTRRFYRINAAADADPGTVFAYEATVEEDTVFSQFLWPFQDDLPHLLSRFQLTVPAGWKAEAKAYRGAKAQAEANGTTFTWEERKLGPLEVEPSAPGFLTLLPRIAVSMVPPEGMEMGKGPIACFRNWRDVSRFKSGLIDPQAEVTAAIESKTKQLIEGKPNELERMRSVAEFVQRIRYVSISINSARGGGYVPHKAEEVLKMAYGDCKDKTNLLRTMLKTMGVESYPVAIFAGDSRMTQEDFPSPHLFNHAILAIRVKADVEAAAVMEHAELGRLLLFDPTDEFVPFGFLPDHEQNSNALITAGERGTLVRTPMMKPSENRRQRVWELQLNAEGGVSGRLIETSQGQEAFDERRLLETMSKENYRKRLERMLGRPMAGATIQSTSEGYDAQKHEFRLEVQFAAPDYARVMQGRLWMVRSMPVEYSRLPNVNSAKREQPLVIQPVSFAETVRWKLPAELKLDEVPDGDSLKQMAGALSSDWTKSVDGIEARREIEMPAAVVGLADYGKARELVTRFHGAGEAPIVLVKK